MLLSIMVTLFNSLFVVAMLTPEISANNFQYQSAGQRRLQFPSAQNQEPYCGYRNRYVNPWHAPVDNSCNPVATSREECESTSYILASSSCIWHGITEGGCLSEDPNNDSICNGASNEASCLEQFANSVDEVLIGFNQCHWFQPPSTQQEQTDDSNDASMYCGYPSFIASTQLQPFCSTIAKTQLACELSNYLVFLSCQWKSNSCHGPNDQFKNICGHHLDQKSCESTSFLDQGPCQWLTVATAAPTTPAPTLRPSSTRRPTPLPTTHVPTLDPTRQPSHFPSQNPTSYPSTMPPSWYPSLEPTDIMLTHMPTWLLSSSPSSFVTPFPTRMPSTSDPTTDISSSIVVTAIPTNLPSSTAPTLSPSIFPSTSTPSTGIPSTSFPSRAPTGKPSIASSSTPSQSPSTLLPSDSPSILPTAMMTFVSSPPSTSTTTMPSFRPTFHSTPFPTLAPTTNNNENSDDNESGDGGGQQIPVQPLAIGGAIAALCAATKGCGFCNRNGKDDTVENQDIEEGRDGQTFDVSELFNDDEYDNDEEEDNEEEEVEDTRTSGREG